jgi:hypothetical protein
MRGDLPIASGEKYSGRVKSGGKSTLLWLEKGGVPWMAMNNALPRLPMS